MPHTDKLDLFKHHKDDYVARKGKVHLVTVGPGRYLSIAGQGSPDGEAFQQAVGAMYGCAYTIKMTRKFSGENVQDYKIAPLEGLWWAPGFEAGGDFTALSREQWQWQLLIRTPEFITDADLADAQEKLLAKGKGDEVRHVSLETVEEGLCVQALHVGPYAQERETIQRMLDFAESEGLTFAGRHHEIYLSDPRRCASEKLRTILRMPVRKSDA